MIHRFSLSGILLLSFFLAVQTPSLCAEKFKKRPGISRYVQIPILYMTDRGFAKNNFLNQRKLEEGSIYDVFSGSADCIIENLQYKTLTPAQEKLGWQYLNKLPKNQVVEAQLTESGKKGVYTQFGKKLVQIAENTGHKEFFMSVHGFNNPFDGSAKSAAKLAYAVERPVILYSWPSAARIVLYEVDSGNNEWSQEHFNRLMEELIYTKNKHKLRFSLVAHSMGNRLVIRAAEVLKGQRLFEQAFLVDPDMDAETFVHYVARYAVGGIEELEVMAKADPAAISDEHSNVPENSEGKLRILFSHHDNALPIVQLLFGGGYTRLGQGADTLLSAVFDPDSFSNFLQSTVELFQDDDNDDESKNKTANKKEDAQYFKLARAFEWIDYTVLDHGILGHTIPFELIANLWSTGKPGQGLALVTTENKSVNRFTRFASRVLRQTKHVGDVGQCEKVVFAKDVKAKFISAAH